MNVPVGNLSQGCEVDISDNESRIETLDNKTDEEFNRKDMDIELWSKRDDNVWDTWWNKLVFTYSIFHVGLVCYALGGAGGILPWYYSIIFPFLLMFRFIQI